ncbi:uncharacterized protein LOC111395331 [Olea europaea var. sylvestris]|uniref:uncharacterized protein LOC111395331 n=1 Tax=Olea europaea var. sylvestris TaxID=158386 RepID=UPI000C1D0697|nr:uncharacterized protein LOC111395331 [Olea europaea var. sylvestris]
MRIWSPRKSKNVIGRIVSPNPCEGERYFLRVLLNHIRGPKSFKDLKKSMVLFYLLIVDQHIPMVFLVEIAILKRVYLRQLLTKCPYHCGDYLSCPTNPRNLWDKFKNFIIEDYLHIDFNLTMNDDDTFETMTAEETTNINFQSYIHYRDAEKTYLYKTLLFGVRSQNLIALTTSSLGVAASLLPVGKQSALGKLLALAWLIIWDETPLVHKYAFEALNKMSRDITECQLPFGGKVIVCGGNFRQVLPVVQRGSKYDIMKLALIENMIAKLDPSFSEYLLKIGNGIERTHSCQKITLPEDITINFEDEFKSLKELIDIRYPSCDVENHRAEHFAHILVDGSCKPSWYRFRKNMDTDVKIKIM